MVYTIVLGSFKIETETTILGGGVAKRKPRSDRSPSRFWGRTRLTEDVAHSLNDAVFKLFLILPVVPVC